MPTATAPIAESSRFHGSFRWRDIVSGLTIALILCGCGGASGKSTVDSSKANDLLSQVTKAINEKDWKTAETEATTAIDSNALDASQLEDARIARFQARIESGNTSGAEEDLAFLENSDAPSKADEILVLKSQYQLKTGKKAEARKTFQLAKKINKKLKTPAGL